MKSSKLTIYTDGGCTGNPGPGGWATVILHLGREIHISGGEANTTNNRMELTAVIKALTWVIEKGYEKEAILLYTDSQYVQKGITEWIGGWIRKGWRTAGNKPVKNSDLWVLLKEKSDLLNIQWRWVEAHSGNHYNELCDTLVGKERARAASQN